MKYVAKVAFEVQSAIAGNDPDVRSIHRLPGYVTLQPQPGHPLRYQLTLELEAGSLRDAMDAADELLVEYEAALGKYRPRVLEAIAPEPR